MYNEFNSTPYFKNYRYTIIEASEATITSELKFIQTQSFDILNPK